MITRRFLLQSAAAAAAYSAEGFRAAQAENAPGVTDTEIKIGQTMPYSGPVSGYRVYGRADLRGRISCRSVDRRSVSAAAPF